MPPIQTTYKTISDISTAIYKVKGSKFLSFAIPVADENSTKKTIAAYRAKYHDARHICYAYMIGEAHTQYRANDDGEPSGTAGRPILGQINAFELTNILIIVIRYFGGILLGTGGLISAYKEATILCLQKADIQENRIEKQYRLNFEYAQLNDVMRVIKTYDVQVLERLMTSQCEFLLSVRLDKAEQFYIKTQSIYLVNISKIEN